MNSPFLIKRSIESITKKSNKTGKISLVTSVLVVTYWLVSNTLNVYYFPITGAIFEILWLPMLGAIVVIPIVSLILLIAERFNKNSLHYYPLLLVSLLWAFLYFR